MLHNMPVRLQHELGLGSDEEVNFTQITAAVNIYRDAVRFKSGREVLLQQLQEGQCAEVLELAQTRDPEPGVNEFLEVLTGGPRVL